MESNKTGTKRTSDAPLICLVCGDVARGLNFDVVTCMSCKAFFRRNALHRSVSSNIVQGGYHSCRFIYSENPPMSIECWLHYQPIHTWWLFGLSPEEMLHPWHESPINSIGVSGFNWFYPASTHHYRPTCPDDTLASGDFHPASLSYSLSTTSF